MFGEFGIQCTNKQGNVASYTIGPLEEGYGRPLGNTLRRVLLSSLPGAAVTAVRIVGVLHEFQELPGALEDVTDLVLNIKQLRLRSFSDHPVSLWLEVSGARRVTAANITVTGAVEVVNPDLSLFTLDDEQASLTMELIVQIGRGFVPAVSQPGQQIGLIPVDALYCPITWVRLTVEPTWLGEKIKGDIILLELTTDGTMTPDEALKQSAQILVHHFSVFANYQGAASCSEAAPSSFVPIPPAISALPLDVLDLSVRALNSLRRSGITRIGQILEMEEADFTHIRSFGEKSLEELYHQLQAHGCLPQLS